MKEKVVSSLKKILENDSVFTEGSPEQRAKEIVEHLNGQKQVDLSPSRYGVVRDLGEKTMLSVYKKGHNFYNDFLLEEIDITGLQ